MQFIFIIITFVFGVLFIYPYFIYPFILNALPRYKSHFSALEETDGEKFSLLFCAYNEAASLPDKISNLKALHKSYPKMKFLAFDDGSSDDTVLLLESGAPFVKLIKGGGRNGKAYGMKLLHKLVDTEFIIFTDANVLLDIDAPKYLMKCYSDAPIGGICGALHYIENVESVTSSVGGLYWKLEEKIKDLESASGNVMGADGSVFSVRTELYPDFPDTVLDDMTVSMNVIFQGKRLFKDNSVKAYEKLVSSRKDEFSRKIRIASRAYHTHLYLLPHLSRLNKLDKFKYASHKFIRWHGALLLSLFIVSMLVSIYFISPISMPFVIVAFSLLIIVVTRLNIKPFAQFFEILLALIATQIGVIKAMRGKTMAIWSPAKSRS